MLKSHQRTSVVGLHEEAARTTGVTGSCLRPQGWVGVALGHEMALPSGVAADSKRSSVWSQSVADHALKPRKEHMSTSW